MLVAFVAAGFGAFEAFLLKKLLFAATSGNFKQLVTFMAIKFVTYATSITLLLLCFKDDLIYSVIGFSIGMPGCTIIWFIHKTIHERNSNSGDGINENNNNN